jgi:hypothetical protein
MLPISHAYWLNTGDNDNNFMRSTYAATCRSHISYSIERCPRAGRGIQSLSDPYICVSMLIRPVLYACAYCLALAI